MQKIKTILITGGAGYIGSQTLLMLLKQTDHKVIVLDSLEKGYKESLDRVKKLTNKDFVFIKGDLKDQKVSMDVISTHRPDCVIHFAAYKSVSDGQAHPDLYHENNVVATKYLLDAMIENKVPRIIFSSSAAVYAPTTDLPITESHAVGPINVYGQTKLDMEKLIGEYTEKYDLESIAFRYFNAVGADKSGDIGEDPSKCTNLVPLVMQVVTGARKNMLLFGNNFNTKDGSQERDYIHVEDLAQAHINAIDAPLKTGQMHVLNLSTNQATSCLEIFTICEELTGKKIPVLVTAPREGDPEIVYAISDRAKTLLDWDVKNNINESLKDQLNWILKNPKGYK